MPRVQRLSANVKREAEHLLRYGNREVISSNAFISRPPPDYFLPSVPPKVHSKWSSWHLINLDAGLPQYLNIENQPLQNYTVALKDNIATTDAPTTCGSEILRGYWSPVDAKVVEMLKEQGAVFVGKTNMDEFGMGSHSTHSAFGAVQSGPDKSALSAGGSSGGSAMAVALQHCRVALGTDTGGSVRLPAAYTGLVGFKPSYGMISRWGIVPYAHSLDTVGILARDCVDVFLLYKLLSVPDSRDPTCLSQSTRARVSKTIQAHHDALQRPVKEKEKLRAEQADRHISLQKMRQPERPEPNAPYRIGFPIEYNIQELHPSVRQAWIRALTILEATGHQIVPISLPSTQAALSAYYVLAPAEASSNLAKYDGVRYGQKSKQNGGRLFAAHRGAHFGQEVKRRILLGTFSLSADAIDNYFIQAQKVRRLVQQDFDLVFRMKNPLHDTVKPEPQGVDFILCPTAPTPPPLLAEVRRQTPLDAYMNDVFTVPASLAGLPAISIPMLPENKMQYSPETMVGMQVIGQYGTDEEVIKFVRREFEQREDWRNMQRFLVPERLR